MEKWEPILKHENYEASDQGRIRRTHDQEILKGCIAKSTGYKQYRLNGKSICGQQLVWAAFHWVWSDRQNNVHHKNEDKIDNRLENLKLITSREHKHEHLPIVDSVCNVCETPFEGRISREGAPPMYCSSPCRIKAYKIRHDLLLPEREFTCVACGKIGSTTRKKRLYCDRLCKSKGRSKKARAEAGG